MSEGNWSSNWAGDNSYDIGRKTVAAFSLIPRACLRLNQKSNGLISLAEEILRQPTIDSGVWLISDHCYEGLYSCLLLFCEFFFLPPFSALFQPFQPPDIDRRGKKKG